MAGILMHHYVKIFVAYIIYVIMQDTMDIFIVFQIIILIFSVIIHEVSHGAMARFLGDKTAEYAGRLTLNPLKHIDPMGSIILPAILILSHSPILFGWAKPVPYNPYNLQKGGKYAESLVALAGPLANIALALVFGLLARLHIFPHEVNVLVQYIVFLNIFLAFFNLIPVPPLDGSKVIIPLLPHALQYKYEQLRKTLEHNPFLGFGLVIFLVTLFGDQFYALVVSVAAIVLG